MQYIQGTNSKQIVQIWNESIYISFQLFCSRQIIRWIPFSSEYIVVIMTDKV